MGEIAVFGNGLRLFKLFGFSVEIDASWLIIALLIAWSLASGYFPAAYPNMSTATYWWMGIVGALGLFVCIVIHEFSHSLVARQYGIEMRGIRLFVFGGVAEMGGEPGSPGAEFVMAIAGPIASVLIAAATYQLHWFALQLHWGTPAQAILWYLTWINAALAIFNMVPAFPLDGGRVLRSVLWKIKGDLQWATRIASYAGSAFAAILITLGVLSLLAGSFIGGMWWILLGMFLWTASRNSYQQLLVERALLHESVQGVMQTDVQTVQASIPIQELVEHYVYQYRFKIFPVMKDGQLLGCVTTQRIKELPCSQWSEHTVAELTEPCTDANSVSPEADALQALRKMTRADQSRLFVVDEGQLRGVVTLQDLSRLIALKLELEK